MPFAFRPKQNELRAINFVFWALVIRGVLAVIEDLLRLIAWLDK
jgi:hypothetical protein